MLEIEWPKSLKLLFRLLWVPGSRVGGVLSVYGSYGVGCRFRALFTLLCCDLSPRMLWVRVKLLSIVSIFWSLVKSSVKLQL